MHSTHVARHTLLVRSLGRSFAILLLLVSAIVQADISVYSSVDQDNVIRANITGFSRSMASDMQYSVYQGSYPDDSQKVLDGVCLNCSLYDAEIVTADFDNVTNPPSGPYWLSLIEFDGNQNHYYSTLNYDGADLRPDTGGARAAQLTNKAWYVVEQSNLGISCSGSSLEVLTQATDGNLTGYFDWVCGNGAYARENFQGTLSETGHLELTHTSLSPHPSLGGPTGIDTGCMYEGLVNLESTEISNGLYAECASGNSGSWSAVHTPSPVSVKDGESRPVSEFRIRFLTNNGTLAESAELFDETYPTYFVAHGWQPNKENAEWLANIPSEGQLDIALAIRDNAGTPANVILLEWLGAYTPGLTNPNLGDEEKFADYAQYARINADSAGIAMAEAILNQIPSNYSQPIHMIGHSYGTIVNAQVAQSLGNAGISITQFTMLDAPTEAPLNFAPDLDSLWFQPYLADSGVEYVENLYSDVLLNEYLNAFGGEMFGVFNEGVPYGHTDFPFFADTDIQTGYADDFIRAANWVTPPLATYDTRPAPKVYSPTQISDEPITRLIEITVGNVTQAGSTIQFYESSPAIGYYELTIPDDAPFIAFQYSFENIGDGDWLNIRWNDELLLSVAPDNFDESGIWFNGLLDLSSHMGESGKLFIELNSVGNSNAAYAVRDFSFVKMGSITILRKGTNLISMAGAPGNNISSCFKYLEHLGGDQVVETISASSNSTETQSCQYDGTGNAVGSDFPIETGRAYFVTMETSNEANLTGVSYSCTDIQINPGKNLVGVPSPRINDTCYDVLDRLGQGATVIERFRAEDQYFEACALSNGVAVGHNFPIRAADGLIIHASEPIGPINLNDETDTQRCP